MVLLPVGCGRVIESGTSPRWRAVLAHLDVAVDRDIVMELARCGRSSRSPLLPLSLLLPLRLPLLLPLA